METAPSELSNTANVTLKNWTAASSVALPFQVKYRKSGTSDVPTVVDLNLPVTPGGGVGTASLTLSDLSPGIYDVLVKCNSWLASKLSNIDVTASDSTGNMLVLKNGDTTATIQSTLATTFCFKPAISSPLSQYHPQTSTAMAQ